MKFIKPFYGCRDGEIYPEHFAPGDDCPAELEAAAIECAVVQADDAGGDGKLSVDEIRAALTAKGIAFDPKTKKADLLALLPKD